MPLSKIHAALRAKNHELRQSILLILRKQSNVVVTEIYRELQIEQSVASQHLAILRSAGLIQAIRKGKYIYYQITEKLEELEKIEATYE